MSGAEVERLRGQRDRARSDAVSEFNAATAAEVEVERLRSGLRYILELLGEDPDEQPHITHLDLIALKVGYLRGRAGALSELEEEAALSEAQEGIAYAESIGRPVQYLFEDGGAE